MNQQHPTGTTGSPPQRAREIDMPKLRGLAAGFVLTLALGAKLFGLF